MFADDLVLYIEGDLSDISSLVDTLNEDVEHICVKAESFGMKLNPKKSKSIIFGRPRIAANTDYSVIKKVKINGEEINYNTTVKYLGVILDCSMSPKPQVERVIHNVSHSLSKMRHLRNVLPRDVKVMIIKTLIFPLFDYGCTYYHDYDIPGYGALMRRLQVCQNNALRFALNLPYYEVMSPHRNRLGILMLRLRRKLQVATFIHQAIKGQCPQYFMDLFVASGAPTRHAGLRSEKASTNYEKLSLMTEGVKLYNNIEDAVKTIASRDRFVAAYKR